VFVACGGDWRRIGRCGRIVGVVRGVLVARAGRGWLRGESVVRKTRFTRGVIG
jgi:hypothetical protein